MRAKIADIQFKDGEFTLSGELDYDNVMSLYEKSLKQTNAAPTLVFNFKSLSSSNSAGIALMMEWIKLGSTLQKRVQFKSLSDDLLALAKTSGLDALIDL